MEKPISQQFTLAEVVELIAPFEEAVAAMDVALRRLEAEGVRSLVRIQFYGEPGRKEAGAVLTFDDAAAVPTHIDRIKDWPEFKALLRVVKPVSARAFGPMPPEVEVWLRNAFPVVEIFENHIGGFIRKPLDSADSGV